VRYSDSSLEGRLILAAEVVLSVMIEAFSFDLPSKAKIIFPMANIVAPTTEGHENEAPHMPLKVSVVTRRA
jgi:hypothetical protein